MKTADLLQRYRIERSTLNYRLAYLRSQGFQLDKDDRGRNVATPEQVSLLDDIDRHLKTGRRLEDYILPCPAEVAPLHSAPLTADSPPSVSGEASLAQVIAAALLELDPLRSERAMLWLSQQAITIPTSKVRDLLGVKPTGLTWDRGNWRLHRVGKIGRETAWRVEALNVEFQGFNRAVADYNALNQSAV